MKDKKVSAIILAAGKGSRMKSDIPKQFLEISGKPIIYYALKTFAESDVDDIVLVTGSESIEFCRKEIVERYGFDKVKAVVCGGSERFDSVYQGLLAVDSEYVLIHDGARAMINVSVINNTIEEVIKKDAVVVGVKSKDTIKVTDDENVIYSTTNRTNTWVVQTPQAFKVSSIREAYEKMYEYIDDKYSEKTLSITDDAMVMERFGKNKVYMIEGDYSNIKITTPDDLIIAKYSLENKK